MPPAGAPWCSSSTTSSSSSSSSSATKTYTGSAVDTRWGTVQVQITVKNGKIVTAKAVQYPQNNGRDLEINSYAVPTLNAEAVKASFDRGVLEVRIPKPEQRKPRKVAISVGAGETKTIEGTEHSSA